MQVTFWRGRHRLKSEQFVILLDAPRLQAVDAVLIVTARRLKLNRRAGLGAVLARARRVSGDRHRTAVLRRRIIAVTVVGQRRSEM
jgi:hypothetical protein